MLRPVSRDEQEEHAKPNEKKEPKPRTATASEEAISEEERVGLSPDVTEQH